MTWPFPWGRSCDKKTRVMKCNVMTIYTVERLCCASYGSGISQTMEWCIPAGLVGLRWGSSSHIKSSQRSQNCLSSLPFIAFNHPVEWPARSPDLTPCDVFRWGHLIKGLDYTTPPTDLKNHRSWWQRTTETAVCKPRCVCIMRLFCVTNTKNTTRCSQTRTI